MEFINLAKQRCSIDHYNWFEKAAKDLAAAKEHSHSGSAYEVPAFYCHQAVEKALKGYILATGGELIPGHDLPFIARNAEKSLPELGELKEGLALVNQYYLEMTYPDDMRYSVSAEIVVECIRIAERVMMIIGKGLAQ